MKIDVVTLFEDFFTSALATGLVGKAIADNRAAVRFIDPRTYTSDAHRTVDDTPYGGGGGMVMKPEPLGAAIAEARTRGPGPVLLMSPQGRPLTQTDLTTWAELEHLVMVCGRYEGFDERVRGLVDVEVSLGDFVLTGGEYAALAIIDGVVRLRPGTLGNDQSKLKDSFWSGLLEHPQYTRPPEGVPEVLRSGDHQAIETWRQQQSLMRTLERRPDLLVDRGLSEEERVTLASDRPTRAVTLVVGGPLTPEAVTAFCRLATAYRVELQLTEAAAEALAAAPAFSAPAPIGARERKRLAKRRRAPPRVERVPAKMVSLADPTRLLGPRLAITHRRGVDLPVVPPPASGPLTLLLGLVELPADGRLPPFRGVSLMPDLPALAAAAVALDRVLGEG